MIDLPVIGPWAGALGLMGAALSLRVVTHRRNKIIPWGTRGDEELEVASRCHGNFSEHATLGLVLLAALELRHTAPVPLLHVLAGSLFLGRLMHAWGAVTFKVYKASPARGKARTLGMLFTYNSLVNTSLLLLGTPPIVSYCLWPATVLAGLVIQQPRKKKRAFVTPASQDEGNASVNTESLKQQ